MNKHATSPEKSHNYSLPVVRCNWVWHKPDDTDVKPGDALKLGVTRCVPDVRPPDAADAAYSAYATIAT